MKLHAVGFKTRYIVKSIFLRTYVIPFELHRKLPFLHTTAYLSGLLTGCHDTSTHLLWQCVVKRLQFSLHLVAVSSTIYFSIVSSWCCSHLTLNYEIPAEDDYNVRCSPVTYNRRRYIRIISLDFDID